MKVTYFGTTNYDTLQRCILREEELNRCALLNDKPHLLKELEHGPVVHQNRCGKAMEAIPFCFSQNVQFPS